MDDKTLHQPLAERRTRREHRQLPKRYRDMLPEPPPTLPPPSLPEDTQTDSCGPESPSNRQVLKSGRNGFGLFQQYFAAHLHEHDPGERVTRIDLTESPNHSL